MSTGEEPPEARRPRSMPRWSTSQGYVGQALRRRRRPAARVGALGLARVDAGHDGHRPQPRASTTPRRGLARAHRQRALRLGLLPALRADVRQRRARRPERAHSRTSSPPVKAAPRRAARHRARCRRRCASWSPSLQARLCTTDAASPSPRIPRDAARAAHPRRLRLLERRARRRLPADQPHPRRLGHGGQRAADGLRQHGDDSGTGVAFTRDPS